jgi:ADP-ribose pyrophosphatase
LSTVERLLEGHEVFRGRMLALRVDTVTTPSGLTATREVVDHPGAVAVVAQEPGGCLVLVGQYRYAVGEELLEIPAGKIDPGEDPECTARRELEEETGYKAGTIRKVLSFYTSPGFSNEVIHLYFAQDLARGCASPGSDEEVVVHLLSPERALEMVACGEIRDAKTVTGILLWARLP